MSSDGQTLLICAVVSPCYPLLLHRLDSSLESMIEASAGNLKPWSSSQCFRRKCEQPEWIPVPLLTWLACSWLLCNTLVSLITILGMYVYSPLKGYIQSGTISNQAQFFYLEVFYIFSIKAFSKETPPKLSKLTKIMLIWKNLKSSFLIILKYIPLSQIGNRFLTSLKI